MNDKVKDDYIKRYEAAKNKRYQAADFLFANNLITTEERKTIRQRIEDYHSAKLNGLANN